MKILSIDTSGQTAGVAIVDGYITIGELTVNTQGLMTHSEILLGMIDSLFHLTRLTLNDMDYIACVCGPGSFTGLRIGAATAQGLARGVGSKPLLAVPTLDALAYNIGCAAASGTLVVPMMDARRAQVYTAFYTGGTARSLQRISDYKALPVSEVLAQLTALQPEHVIFLGDGASAYAEIIRASAFDHSFAAFNNNRQRAASAGVCAMRMAEENNTAPFTLMYIRKPQAERARMGETV